MRIRITWPANPSGENTPLLALSELRVRVTVLEDDRNRASKAEHVFSLKIGNHDISGVKLGPAKASFVIPQASGWREQTATFTVKLEAPDSEAESVQRKVVSRTLRDAARLAVYAIAVSALYVVVLVPNIKGALAFINDQPTLPLLGLGTLLVSFWQDWWTKQLQHPWRPIGTAVLALLLLLVVHLGRVLVINRSLDTLALTDGSSIAPGAFAIVSAADLTIDDVLHCSNAADSKTKDKDCIRFGALPDVGTVLRAIVLLPKRDVGCVDHHPEGKRTPPDSWKSSASCRPTAGIQLDKALATDVLLYDVKSPPLVTRVSAHLSLVEAPEHKAQDKDNGWELKWPKVSELQELKFQASLGEVHSTFVFQRKDPQLDLEVSINELPSEAAVLSPLTKGRGGVLDAQVSVAGVAYGSLVALVPDPVAPPNAPPPPFEPKCWLARSGPRLSRLFVRDEHRLGSSVFSAQRPEIVNVVPICWSDQAPPEYGEIHLDGGWTPSEGWTLELPASVTPRLISILDQDGRPWGRLRCPSSSGAPLKIAPIAITNPTRDIQTLRQPAASAKGDPMWDASATHAMDYWAWACWSGDTPARSYSGNERWALRSDEPGRRYHAKRGGRACYLRVDRSEVSPGNCVRAKELEQAWYATQGPADCDPNQSRLCQ